MRRAPMQIPVNASTAAFTVHEKLAAPDVENEDFDGVAGGLPVGWIARRVDTGAALTVGTAINYTTSPAVGTVNVQQGRRRSHMAVQPWNRNSGTAVIYALSRPLVTPIRANLAGAGATYALRINAILTACGFGSAGGDGAVEFMLAADDGAGKADLQKRCGLYVIQDTATPGIKVLTSSYNASATRTDHWSRSWATPLPLMMPAHDLYSVSIAPSGQFGVAVGSAGGTVVYNSQSSGTGGAFTPPFGSANTLLSHFVITMQSDNGASPAPGWFELDYLHKYAFNAFP